jgi:hypothetical protein
MQGYRLENTARPVLVQNHGEGTGDEYGFHGRFQLSIWEHWVNDDSKSTSSHCSSVCCTQLRLILVKNGWIFLLLWPGWVCDCPCLANIRLTLIILSVGGDVPVDSETLLVTDFINLKVKPAQSFGCTHKSRVCVYVHRGECSCMKICVCNVFHTKKGWPWPLC